MQILDEIKNWVTIKKYLSKPVESEVLERILDAGVRAPSAKSPRKRLGKVKAAQKASVAIE